ncbi:MAG: hypothetical protein U0414_28765 [Polyangiaceae bacterium]
MRSKNKGRAGTSVRRVDQPRARLPRIASVVLLALGVGQSAFVSSCNELDTTRKPRPEATFGDDLYGVLCDRVGAEVFQEDLDGDSYRPVCHYDNTGTYADTVDVSNLPEPKGDVAVEARRLATAKMEALARRRSDLVRAFNALFPDIEIDNVATPEEGDTIRLHDALMALGQGIVPLYEINPYEKGGEALTPATTRALGRLFDAMGNAPEAMQTLAQIWGRQGYRPFKVGLGAVRAMLSYPGLRNFTLSSLGVLGPNGAAAPELQQVLRFAEKEMQSATVTVSNLPTLVIDKSTMQPNRPRSTIEMMRDMMLTEDDAFADSPNDPVRLIAVRDRRGFVVPAGNVPGFPGTVPAPFVDADGDGYADVDGAGRFVDGSGAPLGVASPFVIPGLSSGGDEFGRPDPSLYAYVDTSRTLAAGLTRSFLPLLDATQYADAGDPNAFQVENETLMYALSGSYMLFGGREDAEYDFDSEKVVPLGTGCSNCVKYSRFRAEDSPVADLIHAAGQVIGDQDSDVVLAGMIDLLENHEPEMARLIAAAIHVKDIANQYDADVAAGKFPPAALPYENPVWDQVAQVVERIVESPGLTAKLLGALADPTTVSPIGGADNMGDAVGGFAEFRDQITYDKNNINGVSVNISVGPSSASDPVTKVDWNKPRSADNRSMLERAMLLIHDARGAKACNKNGAVVQSKLAGLTIDFPPGGSYSECELFEMPDLAAFYLDSLLPANHPKRAVLNLKPGTLNALIDFLDNFGLSPDQLFQDSSGIDGLTLHPSPKALNRLVFFGADSDQWGHLPDYDSLNENSDTASFIYKLMEPVGASVCPKNSNGVGQCATKDDLLRARDRNSIFTWERLGFYEYLRPMLTQFVNTTCNADVSFCNVNDISGERMFIDLIDILYAHWPGADHGAECNSTGKYDQNPKYCSGAGINRYEPIIAAAARSDIIPALHEFAKAAANVSKVTIARGPNKGKTITGADVLEITTRVLFGQTHAKAVQMKDRHGNKGAKWTDGTAQAQVTPFNMFADAFHAMDVAFASGGEDGLLRQQKWKRARSQLVDTLLGTEGTGANTHFKNKSLAPMLVAILKLTREQVNGHCPDRENGTECVWATRELSKNLVDTLSGPMFASMVDMTEHMQADDGARRELERFLSYLLASASSGDALQSTLASMVDVMQVLTDDAKIAPIIQAASIAAEPADSPSPGCADRTIRVLKALTDDKYDKYHVMDHVLANLVNPIDDGGPESLSPLELIIDSIADIHRLDPSQQEPLGPADYAQIMGTVRDFMTDKNRGLEQLYAIINNRQRK